MPYLYHPPLLTRSIEPRPTSETVLRRALRALVHHLKANYPDTAEARLRAFGCRKESY